MFDSRKACNFLEINGGNRESINKLLSEFRDIKILSMTPYVLWIVFPDDSSIIFHEKEDKEHISAYVFDTIKKSMGWLILQKSNDFDKAKKMMVSLIVEITGESDD